MYVYEYCFIIYVLSFFMMCSAFLAGHYFIKETSYFYARLLSKKFWGFFFVSIWAADYFFFSYFPTEI